MRFLINRKITISMIFIALTFLGYISYRQLLVELLPSTELPVMSVQVNSMADYDPSYIEADVIIPLEGVIAKTAGVEKITSNINIRGGNIAVEFKADTDMKTTSIKFNKEINDAARDLPDGFNITVIRANFGEINSSQFMTLSVKGEDDVDQIRAITEEEIEDKLQNIDGIVGVNIYGGRERSVEVELNNSLAEPLGITPSSVIQSIAGAGNERNFVGYVAKSKNNKLGVFVEGGYNHIDLIGEIVVAEGPIHLRDIATIKSELKEPTSISRVDGKRAISVGLTSESGANMIELAARTETEIEKLNELFAEQGISIEIENSNAEQIEDNIEQIQFLGLVGAVLAVLILWFFLHNLGLALSISLAIPISIFAAFNLFFAFDITINSLTLIGIALAVGMLLDNSIVVLENIYRLYGEGRSAEDAVMEGTRQVWRSIIASTLTTITVFIPFIFTDNIIVALFGKNIGVAIISTLLFSLLVALLLIPMTTYLIIRKKKRSESVFSQKVSIHERTIQIYTIILKSVIRKPAIVITSTMLLLLITFMWVLGRDDESSQNVGSDQISITAEMPEGSTISSSDKTVMIIEQRVDSLAECEQMRTMITEENATVTLKLKEDFDKKGGRKIGEIIDDVWRRLGQVDGVDNINVTSGVSSSNGGGGSMDSGGGMLSSMGIGEQQHALLLKGDDYEEMSRVAEDIETRIKELDFISNAYASVQRGADRIEIEIEPLVAAGLGIGRGELTQGLSSISDEISSNTQINLGEDLIDIVVTKEASDTTNVGYGELKDLNELRNLRIRSNNGSFYNLGDIATTRKDVGKGNIQRVDRSREIRINYRFTQNELPEEILSGYKTEISNLIADYPMPSGMAIENVEEDDIMDEFIFLIAASIVLIFMILATVFESISMPFILLFAIPLAAIGSFVALILSGNGIQNTNTMTGFLILIGVVVNGGIILIDYTNLLRKNGFSRNRALLMSGASRLKPIMITTITTIVALLPMALGDDEYAGAIGAPFAITVIGGLAFSSFLTLILVPTLYMSMEGILKWYKSLPKWMYVIHAILFTAVVSYVFINLSGIFVRTVYIIFAIALIPGLTYIIRNSIRIANNKIISENEPITIEVRNLVKIYDRPNRFKREWQGAKGLRRRLGLDSECKKLSDLKDLLWKGVLTLVLFAGAAIYFENSLWITLMLILWVSLVVSMWNKFYKYYLNKREQNEGRFMRLFNRLFILIQIIIALSTFTVSSENYGLTVLYIILLVALYISYRLARKAEDKNISIERINGRFSTIRRTAYSIALSMPFIGKRKKPFMALKGVSFTINNGMFGLLGSNGAGKSTFMRIITGIYEQSYGTIWINGKDTRKYREELQSLIGFLPQEFGTYEQMSAWDFLNYQAILKGLSDKSLRNDRLEYVLKAVHMYDRKDAKIGSFSGGMKQRIGIALILLNLPRILVVDEPTAGLDPRERIRFRNLLVELSRERIVIFSTHIIEDIASSCNQVVVINKGELRYFGEPNDMLSFAKDKVWSFICNEEEFKNLDHSLVANHMRDADSNIRVRYVSNVKPTENAVQESEFLEDAYLCLLKNL